MVATQQTRRGFARFLQCILGLKSIGPKLCQKSHWTDLAAFDGLPGYWKICSNLMQPPILDILTSPHQSTIIHHNPPAPGHAMPCPFFRSWPRCSLVLRPVTARRWRRGRAAAPSSAAAASPWRGRGRTRSARTARRRSRRCRAHGPRWYAQPGMCDDLGRPLVF